MLALRNNHTIGILKISTDIGVYIYVIYMYIRARTYKSNKKNSVYHKNEMISTVLYFLKAGRTKHVMVLPSAMNLD